MSTETGVRREGTAPVRCSGRNPLGFVVGCPRSGTTLLQRMLNAHPALTVLPEVPWLATAPGDPERVDPAGAVLPGFLRELAAKGSFGRYAHLPVPAGELLQLADAVDGGELLLFRDFAGWLLDRHAAADRTELVVNKTVAAVLHVDALAETFPSARVVHLFRDGRDTAASAIGWRRAPRLAEQFASWSAEPLGTAALWWEWHVRRGREAGRALGPERYREVRYEELVRWPAATLGGICAFLGVEYDDGMLQYAEGRRRRGADLDAKHEWRPVTVGLRDWRTELSVEDLGLFEALAGDLLAELGYADSGAAVTPEAIEVANRLRARFEGRPLPQRWDGHTPAYPGDNTSKQSPGRPR